MFRLALTAVIGGAAKVEELGRNYRAWFEQWLRLQRGRPSHDTLGQTVALPKPAVPYADESRPARALLDLAVATAIHDAIGRQKDLAQPIRSRQDNHTPIVKENRPTLRAARSPSGRTVPRAHRGLSGLATARMHRGMGHGLHWILDMAFGVDEIRVHTRPTPATGACCDTWHSRLSGRTPPSRPAWPSGTARATAILPTARPGWPSPSRLL